MKTICLGKKSVNIQKNNGDILILLLRAGDKGVKRHPSFNFKSMSRFDPSIPASPFEILES